MAISYNKGFLLMFYMNLALISTRPNFIYIYMQITVPSFHLDFGPSFDGVTIRENFSYSSLNGGSDGIKNKRSFGNK